MKNSKRDFYIFDLEIAARKVGASIPTMSDILPVLDRMKKAGRIYPVYANSASMIIGDIAVDNVHHYVTLLVRLSDKAAPNSVYSDLKTGHFNEHIKSGNVGADFGCHVLISTVPEKGLPNIYTCAIERIPGLPFDLVRRFLSKLLSYEYKQNTSFFSYPHPAGGLDAKKQPRLERCCPHIDLRGRPSDALVSDINSGRITGVSLIKSEPVTPISGAAYLTKHTSELKLGIDHNNMPANVWASLTQAFKQNAQTYNTAQVKYRVPNSTRTVTVEIDAATCAPLTEMYICSFEINNIFPHLASSAQSIVKHLHDLVQPLFLSHRRT